MSQWPSWAFGILIGVVLMFLANWALGQAPDTVSKLVDDLTLVKQFVGGVGLAIGLGSLGKTAAATGLTQLEPQTVVGPATLTIASALLLA